MDRVADIHYYWPLLPGAGLVPGGGVRPGLDAGDTGVGVAGVRAVAVGDTLVLAAWGRGTLGNTRYMQQNYQRDMNK